MPGNVGFRYVYSTGQVTKILEKIRNLGRPEKLTFNYVRDTWLLKNEQYRDMLAMLKDMEFLDGSETPTPLYAEYQNKPKARKALSKGVYNAYSELFKAYPEAYKLPDDELEGYFKQHTGASESVLTKIVNTFKTLCNEADFSETQVVCGEPQKPKLPLTENKSKVMIEPNIQIRVEIHIAADTPDDKIKTIFENMKTYLLTYEE